MKIILDKYEKTFIKDELKRRNAKIDADEFFKEYYMDIMKSNFEDDICSIIRENDLEEE